MITYSTTDARKNMSEIIDRVKYRDEIIAIGRQKSIDALIIPFPKEYNESLDDITNLNAASRSFDFLENEPDLYSLTDLRKRYD